MVVAVLHRKDRWK